MHYAKSELNGLGFDFNESQRNGCLFVKYYNQLCFIQDSELYSS